MATQRYFSEKLLARLSKTITEADVKPQFVFNEAKQKGFWRPPRLSLRMQNNLRKACLASGRDPVTFGIPVEQPRRPLRIKPNKLEKHERMRAERQQAIQKNLEQMPQTIQAWKEEKLKQLAKQKSSLPF